MHPAIGGLALTLGVRVRGRGFRPVPNPEYTMQSMVSSKASPHDHLDQTEPWEAQLRKGSLEMAILATLWKSRRYGLEILRMLESSAGLDILEGTLYLILNRLKSAGMVDSDWVDAGSGHPRKYCRLTPAGKQRVRKMARFWSEFSPKLDQLIATVLDQKEVTNAK